VRRVSIRLSRGSVECGDESPHSREGSHGGDESPHSREGIHGDDESPHSREGIYGDDELPLYVGLIAKGGFAAMKSGDKSPHSMVSDIGICL